MEWTASPKQQARKHLNTIPLPARLRFQLLTQYKNVYMPRFKIIESNNFTIINPVQNIITTNLYLEWQ